MTASYNLSLVAMVLALVSLSMSSSVLMAPAPVQDPMTPPPESGERNFTEDESRYTAVCYAFTAMVDGNRTSVRIGDGDGPGTLNYSEITEGGYSLGLQRYLASPSECEAAGGNVVRVMSPPPGLERLEEVRE